MKPSFAVLMFLVITVCMADSNDMRKKAEDNSKKILTDLYLTLRNIVFPKSPLTSGGVSNRFVLMSPGKVLSYLDYFPGLEYEESLLRKNTSAPEALIPPSVMEKWFDIADVIVGGDPFNGGTTGKSMAHVYETIVTQTEIQDVKKKYQEAQSRYNEAYNFLTAPIPDPKNPINNMTRLSVYSYYQDQYAQRKLEMEEKVDEARRTRGSVDYELWFQRNYPTLNSRVEGAYMQWLVFGQKEMVEVYKTYMDTSSGGVELEDAKMALRASGVQSLDRTRTIYPVSFEPGNWYEYLRPKILGPSRDMLLAQKSMLESEIDALTTMISFSKTNQPQNQQTLNTLQNRANQSQENQRNKTEAALRAQQNCILSNRTGKANNLTTRNVSNQCKNLDHANEDAINAAFQQAQLQSEYYSASFFLQSKEQYNGFLQTRIDALNREKNDVNEALNHTTPYLGGVADSREFQDLNKIFNETEQNLDDEWVQFEYDSDSSHVNTDMDSSSVNVAARLISIGLSKRFGLSLEGQYGKTTANLKQALNSASLKVSGELLHVTIKRPWFKPSIFEDSSLFFMQRNNDEQRNTFVSPGVGLSQEQLRDVVNGAGYNGNLYLLPEYVTSFVLSRNVRLQFSGLDSSSVSQALQMMVGGSLSGSYNMFSFAASVGIGKQKQSVTADRTANGMIINIPGAQIIGYYTQVLPEFPRVS